MNKKPLVSILIPLYNSEKYISMTIENCLNQRHGNIEIIIVDDGSTDRSAEIAEGYAVRYDNVKLYRQKNSGAPRARNLAFAKSKGEYIQYLDADDLMSENKISAQIEIAKTYNYAPDIIFSSKFSYFKKSIEDAKYFKQTIDKSYKSGIDWLTDSWSGGGFGVVMGWLTHRKLIQKAGKWDETLKKNQDGEFFSRVLLNAKRVIMTDNTMVYYRRTGSHSISASRSEESVYSVLQSLKKYEKNIEKSNNKQLNEALAIMYANFVKEHYGIHTHIVKEAEKEIGKLGFDINKLPYRGKFGYLVSRMGFHNAVKIYRVLKRSK